jgi:hypothetical protein
LANPKNDFSRDINILAFLILTTGIFAIFGGLYMWGKGSIFSAPENTDLKLFITDIIITGPISILSSIGLWEKKIWGLFTSWLISGIYIYGSFFVYVMVIQNGPPYPLDLTIPPIFGIFIALYVVMLTKKYLNDFLKIDIINYKIL